VLDLLFNATKKMHNMQDLYLNMTDGYQAVTAEMLCVSGIYDSNIKYKYSTATLGVFLHSVPINGSELLAIPTEMHLLSVYFY